MAILTTCAAYGIAARTPGFQVAPVNQAFFVDHYRDNDYAGSGSIVNTIAVQDPLNTPERPIRRRVSLLDRRSLRAVQSTIADATSGVYAFHGLRKDIPFMVIADDYADVYNAVIADWVYAS